MSIGQDEDDKAFEEWWERKGRAETECYPAVYPGRPIAVTKAGTRLGFNAGMRRGEEKRGCCEKRDG